VSTFYAADAVTSGSPADLVTFFTAIRDFFPSGISWGIPSSGDIITTETGQLTGGWSTSGGGTVTSNGGAGTYAAGVGGRVQWSTGTIVNGRRLRGSTFLVPFLSSSYQSDGTIATAVITATNTAAAALVAGAGLSVWHRPSPGGSNGSKSAMTSGALVDRVAVLRTRRT